MTYPTGPVADAARELIDALHAHTDAMNSFALVTMDRGATVAERREVSDRWVKASGVVAERAAALAALVGRKTL